MNKILVFITLLVVHNAFAQVPNGYSQSFERVRINQILNTDTTNKSDLIKSSGINNSIDQKTILTKKNLNFSILPINLFSEFNSAYPFSINNGNLPNIRGLQNKLSAGFSLSWKQFTFRYQPEFLFSNQRSFMGFPESYSDLLWRNRYLWWNNSDVPDLNRNLGQTQYNVGNSYFSYQFANISLSLSNEHNWWGPGIQNALLFTNNAPAFRHLSIKSVKPFKTKIGLIEFQYLVGKLIESRIPPPDTSRTFGQTKLFVQKPEDHRWINGFIISLKPKLVDGLSIGLGLTNQQYKNAISGNLMEFFVPFNLVKPKRIGDSHSPDLYRSTYLRWVFPKALSEIYFEFGKHGRSKALESFLKNPMDQAAFILGFSKLIPVSKNRFVKFSFENTDLANRSLTSINNAEGWYTNSQIRHGHTNQGEWLGAGIGSGGKHQYLEISFIDANSKYSLITERRTNNADFYYYHFNHNGDWRRAWIDYAVGTQLDTKIRKAIRLSLMFKYVYSLNYQWQLIPSPDRFVVPGVDAKNIYSSLNVTYNF
ncbi:MAG: hypothetical protein JXQ90_11275 [Cyclobacteriaceae bacterium]